MTAPPATDSNELRGALAALRAYFKRAAVYSLFTNLLVLTPTFYMLEVYGRVVYSRSGSTLLMLILLAVGLYAVMETLDWVRQQMMDAAGVKLDQQLAERVFDASFDAKLRNIPTGASPLMDLRTVRNFLVSPALMAMLDAPFAVVIIAIIFSVSALLGAAVLIATLAMALVAFYTDRTTRPRMKEAQALNMEAQRYASTTLKNAQVMHGMGMMENIRERWITRHRKFLVAQAQASDHAGIGSSLSKFLSLTQSSLVLGFGCWLMLIGVLPVDGGAMMLAWMLSSRAFAPIQQLIGQWRLVVDGRLAYGRLTRLLTGIPERKPGMPLPRPKGALSVENLVAAAPSTQVPILRGVSFKVSPGQVLAVIGPTASGKSTLARLLVGLWPAVSGKVRLDGVDVFGWNKQELGPSVGYLPQDIELFDGTVAENIARFSDVDMDKVEAATRAVGLHETISALPEGYDTLIGTGGAVLSGGQRQRVALARALYNDPAFIVLDEPNSSLDEPGDRALLQALELHKSRGATIVIITHRANVLAVADLLLVLRDGQLEVFGPRDQALAALKERMQPRPPAAGAPTPTPGAPKLAAT